MNNPSKNIYLDHAATTYLDSRVVEAMRPFWQENFGNPSALYAVGREAKVAIEAARQKVAEILGCSPAEIVFEGSGTESDNHAIIGAALANKGRGNHLITSAIEHHAVTDSCEFLTKQGFEITYIPVDKNGVVKVDELIKALRPETILVSIMYANNEIGTIQPIAEISQAVKKHNPDILVHTDACQAAPYLDLNVDHLGIDLLTINGSKIYGPKGTGALYIRQGVAVSNLIHGGGQENKRRSGTENVPGIVGLAKALELVQSEKEIEVKRLTALRDYLIAGLLKIPKTFLNGHPVNRLPNNVNVSVLDVEGESVLLALDTLGVAISTGSACASGSLKPSHVILALGQPNEAVHGSLRFSLGHSNSQADLDYVLEKLPVIIEQLRKMSPVNLNFDKLKTA